MGRILQMHANHREDIDRVATAGDIAAAVGVKNTTTGDTLCDETIPIILESMEFPEPVISRCYRTQDQGRSGKDGYCSCKACRGRPHLQRPIQMTKQVRQSSPVWANFTLKSSLTDFSVNSRLRLTSVHPQVAYKETITTKSQTLIQSMHVSQAVRVSTVIVKLDVYPNEPGTGL